MRRGEERGPDGPAAGGRPGWRGSHRRSRRRRRPGSSRCRPAPRPRERAGTTAVPSGWAGSSGLIALSLTTPSADVGVAELGDRRGELGRQRTRRCGVELRDLGRRHRRTGRRVGQAERPLDARDAVDLLQGRRIVHDAPGSWPGRSASLTCRRVPSIGEVSPGWNSSIRATQASRLDRPAGKMLASGTPCWSRKNGEPATKSARSTGHQHGERAAHDAVRDPLPARLPRRAAPRSPLPLPRSAARVSPPTDSALTAGRGRRAAPAGRSGAKGTEQRTDHGAAEPDRAQRADPEPEQARQADGHGDAREQDRLAGRPDGDVHRLPAVGRGAAPRGTGSR